MANKDWWNGQLQSNGELANWVSQLQIDEDDPGVAFNWNDVALDAFVQAANASGAPQPPWLTTAPGTSVERSLLINFCTCHREHDSVFLEV